ncbi:helix-turn-helix domain-containing protein [Glycomyces sp. TRM65418]|uniref:winged helix-turn-helix domain-containing protein n=1 Tax=Glycomyces sp. TRM65418 TaxID=2867006 RepID=UPI001CE51384|nr:helix-turn-helix domain-containing protein [Glycomyces sp. TRM65418]MCC3762671.1 helix-turn-helix domain-containing protein [Glycomyces sp. TRM65418]QZD57773.1 helix-turn-helix domain-containing protein [Glycomyces sp. TRM65418]
MGHAMTFVEDPERVMAALSPLRRRLLRHLREPASATQLAAALDLPRQRVNYHLRALEAVELVELVEERRRRGCVERIVRAKPGAFVVDPTVLDGEPASPDQATRLQDQFAAEHLVGVAATTVRDVARMQVKAEEQGKRLLTFTIEADLRFASAADVHRFTEHLTDALRRAADDFDDPAGRPYRVVIGGHPAPATATDPAEEEQNDE